MIERANAFDSLDARDAAEDAARWRAKWIPGWKPVQRWLERRPVTAQATPDRSRSW